MTCIGRVTVVSKNDYRRAELKIPRKSPDGVQIVQGQNSKCTKAQWYSQDTPLISMHTTRDKSMHDRRRRIWSPAFSDKALRGYESRLQKYNDMFIKQMNELGGMSVCAPSKTSS